MTLFFCSCNSVGTRFSRSWIIAPRMWFPCLQIVVLQCWAPLMNSRPWVIQYRIHTCTVMTSMRQTFQGQLWNILERPQYQLPSCFSDLCLPQQLPTGSPDVFLQDLSFLESWAHHSWESSRTPFLKRNSISAPDPGSTSLPSLLVSSWLTS